MFSRPPQPPRVLKYLYRWIDDDEFELLTLHAMVNAPIEAEETEDIGQKVFSNHLGTSDSVLRGRQGTARVGSSPGSNCWSKRLFDTRAVSTNVRIYWSALSSHMDALRQVRLRISPPSPKGAPSCATALAFPPCDRCGASPAHAVRLPPPLYQQCQARASITGNLVFFAHGHAHALGTHREHIRSSARMAWLSDSNRSRQPDRGRPEQP